ncbi:MAG TPA: M20/M25/M40 family metallo-hydrolase [Phycisphaerae bacterium]|nr:M20/M25/M40 family metallo-hydrolase [Phycisphaerae bacterium]
MNACRSQDRSLSVALLFAALAIADITPLHAQVRPGAADEQRLLRSARQLTYEGRRAGEGYFSADGRRMIFQSEREPGNPFFQIYLLELETGDVQRISPGHGKTTCAWIHPGGRRVLYASTHADPESLVHQKAELAERESGRERRYSWDYDAFFDIFEYDLDTGRTTALTRERGYDAEGSYSPDGKLIAFASNRLAYSEALTPAVAERFKHDPSVAIDIYVMNADGSGVRRLTDAFGYDGGPFFSPDGQRICWRRFTPDGATAEVFTMNIDGSDQRQVTRLGAMSWAPFYHPSGEYLIFTTNKHGFANFELYLVDALGQREPVRVTYTSGFDGLPAFSPDGTRLAWTSSRGGGNQGQIFIGDWDHDEARRLLEASPAVAPAEAHDANRPSAAPRLSQNNRPAATGAATRPEICIDDLRADVLALASEQAEGRRTGTPGERVAAEYVAARFEAMGLAPAGDSDGYLQAFPFTAGVAVDTGSTAEILIQGETPARAPLTLDHDWRPLAFSRSGVIEPADVVFAGYGMVAPAAPGQEAYDSYLDLDLRDKWVMVLRHMPQNVSPERRQYLSRYASLRYKAMLARDRGARGIVVVSGPHAPVREQLVPLVSDAALAGTSLAAISLSDAAAARLVGSREALAEAQKALDDGALRPGRELSGARLAARIELKRITATGHNIIARLPAKDPEARARPALVIGAHVDHLGRGGENSLARDEEKGQIHYGADDNASGVAVLLEVAEHLKSQQDSGALALKRDVIFAAWSGEELGLLGSAHFVESLARTGAGDAPLNRHVAAYLNMDMVGRLDATLVLHGVGSSTSWPREIERRNAVVGLPLSLSQDSYLPTDATTFYLAGVPILSAFTGSHEDYHRPSDTPDKLNYEGMVKVGRLISVLARGIATDEAQPDYVKQDPPKSHGARAGLRAYLGTIPDYGDPPIPGLKLSGVASNGPAHAGGLRGGDIIVELAGKKIENVYDYTYALEALKVGEPVRVAVVRDGQRLTFEVTPGSRD